MNEFNQRHQRRAATAVFVAVLLPVLIMCAALSVDVGHLTAVVAEMQHTADGASLAGATALWEERWDEVSDRSVAVIDPMQRSQGFSSLDDQLIEVGRWNWLNNTFTAYPFADAAESNAVRVVSRRAETPYFFARFMRKMSADVRREAVAVISEPCGGIWGLEGVKVPGSVSIDSFDSTDGPYSPATAGSDGDVCSGRDIVVSGDAVIDGDALAGPGYDVIENGGSHEVTGTIGNWTGYPKHPSADFGDVAISNDNDLIGTTVGGDDPFKRGNNLVLRADDELVLQPGTYYFDSVSFGSQSRLSLSGPTTIYVAGDFDATAQSIINTTGDPTDLMIISSGQTVKVSGNNDFYGQIIAPYAEITLSGTADFYGAVIGRTVTVTGDVNFHVDEGSALTALIDTPPPALVK